MIGQIKHIANVQGDCRYERCQFEEFYNWLISQKSVQIDIETDITPWWNTRTLISIQFGSCTYDRKQWFLQWTELTEQQKSLIKQVLEDERICKLAHNVTYEYVVLRFYGIILENVYDTMLCENVLS